MQAFPYNDVNDEKLDPKTLKKVNNLILAFKKIDETPLQELIIKSLLTFCVHLGFVVATIKINRYLKDKNYNKLLRLLLTTLLLTLPLGIFTPLTIVETAVVYYYNRKNKQESPKKITTQKNKNSQRKSTKKNKYLI